MRIIIKKLEGVGDIMVETFHLLALFIIGGTVIWSAASEYLVMIGKGAAELKDILMLFIYLELGAMIGIYFKTKKLPVMFLIYIAITALTRVLAVNLKTMTGKEMLYISGAILVLALAGLVLNLSTEKLFGNKQADM